jgi:hypothetical protein
LGKAHSDPLKNILLQIRPVLDDLKIGQLNFDRSSGIGIARRLPISNRRAAVDLAMVAMTDTAVIYLQSSKL